MPPRQGPKSEPKPRARKGGPARVEMDYTDCVDEMRAFVRGGVAGVERLGRVWRSILTAYGVERRLYGSVMARAGVDFRFGALRVIGAADDAPAPLYGDGEA